jgi:hypothetical protein
MRVGYRIVEGLLGRPGVGNRFVTAVEPSEIKHEDVVWTLVSQYCRQVQVQPAVKRVMKLPLLKTRNILYPR